MMISAADVQKHISVLQNVIRQFSVVIDGTTIQKHLPSL